MIAFYQAECACVCVCNVHRRVSAYIEFSQHYLYHHYYRLRCCDHRRCWCVSFFFFYLFYFNLIFIIIFSTKSNTTNVLAWARTNTLINTSILCSIFCFSFTMSVRWMCEQHYTHTLNGTTDFVRLRFCFCRCCPIAVVHLIWLIIFISSVWADLKDKIIKKVECEMHYEWATKEYIYKYTSATYFHWTLDNNIWELNFLHMQWASQLAHACLPACLLACIHSSTLKRMHSLFMYLFIWIVSCHVFFKLTYRIASFIETDIP